MFVELTDIDRVKGHPLIRVVVSVWANQADADAGQPPVLVNDFIVQFSRAITRIVKDAQGRYLRLDGVAVEPGKVRPQDEAVGWQRETVTKTRVDLLQDLRGHIRGYLQRAIAANRASGDFRDRRVALDNAEDGDGLRAFILPLRGQREEVTP